MQPASVNYGVSIGLGTKPMAPSRVVLVLSPAPARPTERRRITHFGGLDASKVFHPERAKHHRATSSLKWALTGA